MDPRELIGAWRFDRAIRDHTAGVEYRARGEAQFLPLPDARVRWGERGVLSWAGGSTPVARTLFLVPGAACALAPGAPSPAWAVTFEDGREFHAWNTGAVSHWCAPDRYHGEISAAEGTDSWAISWTVTGPRKNYVLTSTYRRKPPVSS